MRIALTVILLLLSVSFRGYACDCECAEDCSFHKVVKASKLVALVKVISYDGYLSHEIMGYDKKMPQCMTVEIIKKYRGAETRQKIKVWGDDGHLCRPYIANFKIGAYFLIAPDLIEKPATAHESKTDYELFSCATDYLKVDMKTNTAHGEYTKQQNKITLAAFERTMKN